MIRSIGMAALAGAAVLAVSAPAFAGFGAIAYDEATGKYGFSWNDKTAKGAEENALKDCGASGCKVVIPVKPQMCGALATTEGGKGWTGAVRPTVDAAKLAALESCQKKTPGKCVVRGSECNK